jgi:hypothetical protein
MSTTKEKYRISEALQDYVSTRADTEPSVIRGGEQADDQREAWQQVIDRKLIDWGCHPEQMEDEGIDPPSRETISRAIRLVEAYRDQGCPAPDSVVLDPNGGIVFERREQDISEVLHLWEDGATEYLLFRGTQLVQRRIL